MEKGTINQQSFIRMVMVFIGLLVGTFIVHDVQSQDVENTLLWEVKGEGIKTSYLYGTIHILSQNDFELKDKVKDAFATSEQIVLEMDMDNPNMQAELMQNMGMKNGVTLDKLFSEEEYALVSEQVSAAIGAGLENFNTFKPFFLTSVLITTLIEGPIASFEGTFVAMAKEQEKEVLGLETPTYQASIFDEIPYEEQASDVMDMVQNRDRNIALFDEMVGYYNDEDINGLYAMIEKELSGENEFELLIQKRNKEWISKIKDFTSKKPTFIAVGSAHLAGDVGVIRLLRDEGFELTPLN